MTPILRRDVHIVRIGPDLVWLDLRCDAYQALRGAGECWRLGVDGALQIEDALADRLRASGLFEPAGVSHVSSAAQSRASPATRDAIDHPVTLSAPTVAQAALELGQSAALFARQPLRRLMGRSGSKPRAPRSDIEGAVHLAAEFAHLLSLSPWSGACLFHAFALRRRLRRRGYDADWVFAVRTWPFQAHCWLQVDDVVLTDRVERLKAFTPLLVA